MINWTKSGPSFGYLSKEIQQNTHWTLVRLLVQDPRTDLKLRDCNGRTPLQVVAAKGRKDIMQLFSESPKMRGDKELITLQRSMMFL